jgi:tryptophanyl-tRNA synthetase
MRILSGVQPSGKLHIGNYYGALRQFLTYQAEHEALYFIADLHALTSVRDGATLRGLVHDVALDFLALGLDPNRAVIFRQSDVPQHAELAWILATVSPMGLLERGHSYKDKTARGLAPDVGLFTYPILMAADILLYGADRVPVGQDQKQHLEMARDIATKFNMTYVPGYRPADPTGTGSGVAGVLKLPEPLIMQDVAVIPGLDGQKMSKSYNNTIELFAPDKATRKKIMGIKTDSTPVEAPKPDGSPLLALLERLAPPDEFQEHRRSWQAGGVGYGTYKQRLYELFIETFGPARARRQELAQNPQAVARILRDGAEQARAKAAAVFNQVVEATGCGQKI